MDLVKKELEEIGSLIREANLLHLVREEISHVKSGLIVTSGKYASESRGHDVVVRCGDHSDLVCRRLKSSSLNVDIDVMPHGVLGIRSMRRG